MADDANSAVGAQKDDSLALPDQPNEDEDATNSYACNECRRRKARCTRELPTCSVCKKNGRHCLYQRHSRTPLTRKRLTEVEELLRIATRIIAERLPDVDLGVELKRSRNGESLYSASPQHVTEQPTTSMPRSSKRQRQASECSPDHAPPDRSNPTDMESDLYNAQIESLLSAREDDQAFAAPSPDLSLDNLSPEKLDYDWDERRSEAGIGLDGMGSMSLSDEKPGYLGLASGATLLNLIQSYTSDPFVSFQPLQTIPALPERNCVPSAGPVDLNREIPNHRIAQYITDYFNTYHVSYPLVHQGLFMAQYNEIIPRPQTGWMVLMYTVAAIGAFMAATTSHDDDVVLFRQARSHLSVEMLEVGNLTLVQSLTLISNYLQKRDRPNSGYNYLGIAVRMAYGLGLHKDFPNWKTNLLQSEMRRRVWWCLYIFDAGTTITYSRPLGIPSTGIDARLPLNVFDSDLNAGTTSYPENAPTPTIYTNVRIQSQFHLLTNSLYNRIISKPCPSAKQVLAWDDLYIGKWLNAVPEWYRDGATVQEHHALAHAIMTWRYKNLRMILYRPFLMQSVLLSAQQNMRTGQSPGVSDTSGSYGDGGNQSEPSAQSYNKLACERCRIESHETIQNIDYHWTKYSHTRMASWYAMFFLFPAVLVPLMSLRNEPQSASANSWREDIGIAVRVIRSMVELNPSAARFLGVLERLSAGFFAHDPAEVEELNVEENLLQQPIDESPITQMLSMRSLMFPDTNLYGLEGQFLYGPEGSSAFGMPNDNAISWPDYWDASQPHG